MRSRGMIRLKGADVVPFLQGMVTNDVSQLVGDGESMYTMMLNPQVRGQLFSVALNNISTNCKIINIYGVRCVC